MATAVIMPRQGQSVESCIITEWHKQVGEQVRAGDKLFTYETDKAVFEEQAKQSGTLLARFFEADDDVPVLLNIAVIGDEGEDISGFAPNGSDAAENAENAGVTASSLAADTAPAVNIPTEGAGVKEPAISPRAKATAQRMELNPRDAKPTGPGGRVIERDIIALARQLPAFDDGMAVEGHPGTDKLDRDHAALGDTNTPENASGLTAEVSSHAMEDAQYEEEKLSNLRKLIAGSMCKSLSEMAQLTHTASFDATRILAYRQELKASMEATGIPNITLNDMILFAVSRVLPRHRDLNAHLLGDSIRRFKHVHLGMAVDTPRGLMVPTIINADKMSLSQIALRSKALAEQAKKGNIGPDELQGATFTISNLGAFGIESFTPIINPPQTGILGVNTITEQIRSIDGQISSYKAISLSLSYDHRALDGAPASRFLHELCKAMENFTALLV